MSSEEFLALITKVANGSITQEQASAEFATKKSPGNTPPLTCKVSPKGCLSVYGLQRWPVTLYATQWERLLDNQDKIRKAIADNATVLTYKTQ